ncbi:hypothetical protein J0X19_22010 [Hymenobacter sp. BT186]|uniref:XRE family transcriptional regulator n=1 Tax=Hymenobacter telluris TaxID=2816474 RepID=A0A939F0S2_9BACT|nr:hypothetical protein [Hymenobacter telluris]MBO0360651.1 hypothetical protein [Hymenobacter telluris]MBW3376678.1 hypothetical protein [Hymenobacter norwichensis]
MQQHPINQRISFLLQSFKLSARAFSEAIGEKPTITQNYVGTRNSMPGADYIEKVLKHFESINPAWFLTGAGEPFIGDAQASPVTISSKKNKGGVQANNIGQNTINNISLEDCKRSLESSQQEIEQLKAQLASKDALLGAKDDLIAAKEEMLSLLRAGHNRPN